MAATLRALIPIPGIFLGMAVLILVACETGYLLGHHHHRLRPDKEAPTAIGPMVAGLLSMLGFALALIFSMAVGEYQMRSKDVAAEATAIHNAYLFADLVPVSQKSEIKRLLRRYVGVRLQVVHDGGLTG